MTRDTTAQPKAGLRAILLGVLLILVLATGFSVVLTVRDQQRRRAQSAQLPVLGNVMAFTLTDSAGAPVSLAQFSNKVWTANFFFTTCTSICPPLMRNLMTIRQNEGADVNFAMLSVTVDPEHDAPAVLAAYAAEHQIDTQRWHLATGSRDAIKTLSVQGLKIGMPDQPLAHSPHIALVDQQGQIRGYYDGLDAKATGLLSVHIKQLLGTAGADLMSGR